MQRSCCVFQLHGTTSTFSGFFQDGRFSVLCDVLHADEVSRSTSG